MYNRAYWEKREREALAECRAKIAARMSEYERTKRSAMLWLTVTMLALLAQAILLGLMVC